MTSSDIHPPATDAPGPGRADWRSRVPASLLAPAIVGLCTVGVFIAGFSFWAFRAPLAGAVIAPGIVVASGQNQEVGHFEGGIIREIVVRDGERVSAGQPLIYLDETIVEADRNRVGQSLLSYSARMARAMAELKDAETLRFPDDVREMAAGYQRDDVLELQRAEFDSRRKQHLAELSVMDEQVQAIEEEITGLQQQVGAEQKKLAVIEEDIQITGGLLEQGLTSRTQYNALLRAKADAEGAIGRLNATVGQRNKSISEIRERQTTLKAARRALASTEINEMRTQIADLREQLTSRADILERMVIRAPVDGIIVDMTKNTIGSVVLSGEPVLNILPTAGELVIQVRVLPQDADAVQVGQEARVRFAALNSRTTPEVDARVEYVSADRLVDPVTQEPYFEARLALASDLPPGLNRDQIFPGMPVDSFISTGERTFVEYLAKPITDSFSKAFREE